MTMTTRRAFSALPAATLAAAMGASLVAGHVAHQMPGGHDWGTLQQGKGNYKVDLPSRDRAVSGAAKMGQDCYLTQRRDSAGQPKVPDSSVMRNPSTGQHRLTSFDEGWSLGKQGHEVTNYCYRR